MGLNYKYVFMDFDGTIADTSEGIISSLVKTLAHFGVEVEDQSFLRRFIGPPLGEAFCEHYGFSGEQAEEAVACYREFYSGGEMFKCRLYDGVYDMLAFIKGSGAVLCTGTSKPEPYTEKLLDMLGVRYLFDAVYGAAPEKGRYKKKEVLEYALSSCGIRDRREALLVGDTKYDIIGAKQVGIATAGVLYGFGSLADLVRYEADYICPTPRDVCPVIYTV